MSREDSAPSAQREATDSKPSEETGQAIDVNLRPYQDLAKWLHYWWGSPFVMQHLPSELKRACEHFGVVPGSGVHVSQAATATRSGDSPKELTASPQKE